MRAAYEAADEHPGGVFFVPLTPISDTERIVQTTAEAVKFPLMTQEDPQTQLLRYLRHKQLLVMDNFEQLLDGVQIVSEILSIAPGMKILATSREKLNLVSEMLYFVAGMNFSLPERPPVEQKNDASALFIQSAHKVWPGFEPGREELVQGIPLAIELAAAWLQILTLDEISAELGQSFDILSTEARDALVRHRSLRAVFEHSWNLLDSSEREILMSQSTFGGGFTHRLPRR